MFKRVPGTKDILPEEASGWQEIERISRNIFSLYQYREVRTPIIEELSLYNRSLGEFTEIVQKQMFIVKNKLDTYVLRPEGTASLVRAYIENNLDKTVGLVKFYYMGPMFRLERPQKGRLRQFHHIGAEVIGSGQPNMDIEIISLANKLLINWGVSGYEIVINSLGCTKDKRGLIKILQEALKDKLDNLCADCQARFKNNPLRVLDCKNEACREIIKKLDIRDKHLCSQCRAHFSSVRAGLDLLGIKYILDQHMVRGLDYYTRTVFEIKHDKLGSQDALGAGGRYDNLVKELGGPDVGAMGFAFGVERLSLVSAGAPDSSGARKSSAVSNDSVYIIPLGKEAQSAGLKLLDDLRNAGIAADTDYEDRSLKGAMRRAGSLKVRCVLIIGEDELKKNTVTMKDMSSGEQKEIKAEDLVNELRTDAKIKSTV